MVQKITLASGDHSIRFGNAALIEFEEATGLNFLAGFDPSKIGIKNIAVLCHAGLKDAAKLENKEFTKSIDEVIEELNHQGSILQVITLFSQAMPQLIGKGEDEKKAGKQAVK
jgi:hypothetical protein